MIKGFGTDLVELARIRRIYEKFGCRFTGRFLAPEELGHMPANAVPWLAGRFAAKEACAKALGTGFQNGIHWQDILVLSDELGKPVVKLRGHALDLARQLGVNKCHLSISHERLMACAVLILED